MGGVLSKSWILAGALLVVRAISACSESESSAASGGIGGVAATAADTHGSATASGGAGALAGSDGGGGLSSGDSAGSGAVGDNSSTERDGGSGSNADDGVLTIYYIRHGETELNAGVSGDQGAFTDTGVEQIDVLTDHLLDWSVTPDAILVSPTWRTQNTIAPYLEEAGLSGEIWVELEECETMTPTGGALPTAPPVGTERVTFETDNLEIRDGQSRYRWVAQDYEDCVSMAMAARDLLLERFSQSGLTLFIVGHQNAGNLLVGLLTGHDMLNDIPASLALDNTGIQHLEQDAATGEFELVGVNVNLQDCAYTCSDHCVSIDGTPKEGSCSNPEDQCCDLGEEVRACEYACSDHCASIGGLPVTGRCTNPEDQCCDFG